MEIVQTDVLVVGGGGAAARAALSAARAGAQVRMLVKSRLQGGGSTAMGASEIFGITAALGYADPHDNTEWHFRDTMAAARGLVDPRLVRILVEESPARVLELVQMGVPFDREPDGRLKQHRSDFQTYPRALSVGGRTGPAILEALLAQIKALAIPIDENVMAATLLKNDVGRVTGVIAVDIRTGEPRAYLSRATILGTGGVGAAFSYSVDGSRMTGDGYAMAYEVGADLVNMEFTQVAPAMIRPTWAFLSGPVYQLEPKILNDKEEEFLQYYLPVGITPKEVFGHKSAPYTTSNPSRYLDEAIEGEMRAGRRVFFDLSHIPEANLLKRLPNTVKHFRSLGIDLTRDRFEVGILFHLVNGGIRITDSACRTSIPGLFVAGEAAGGIRGPNRPGGNSLAEGQVFGHLAGLHAAKEALQVEPPQAGYMEEAWNALSGKRPVTRGKLEDTRRQLQEGMTLNTLVAKDAKNLNTALNVVLKVKEEACQTTAADPSWRAYAIGTRNAALCAELMIRGMLAREETRGSHYRIDFREQDDERWAKSISLRKSPQGPLPLLSLIAYKEAPSR